MDGAHDPPAVTGVEADQGVRGRRVPELPEPAEVDRTLLLRVQSVGW